jgi:hypothetical protein
MPHAYNGRFVGRLSRVVVVIPSFGAVESIASFLLLATTEKTLVVRSFLGHFFVLFIINIVTFSVNPVYVECSGYRRFVGVVGVSGVRWW